MAMEIESEDISRNYNTYHSDSNWAILVRNYRHNDVDDYGWTKYLFEVLENNEFTYYTIESDDYSIEYNEDGSSYIELDDDYYDNLEKYEVTVINN